MQYSLPIHAKAKGWKRFLTIYNLFFLWVIVQALLFHHNGIVTLNEADKYITEAHIFIDTGSFYSPNYWLYSTEIFLIIATLKLHVGFIWIVFIQLLLNFIATGMFYRLALNFLNSTTLAFIATGLFILNILYQVYNTYLFTESLFYSLSIIFSCYLLLITRLTAKNITLLVLVLCILCVTRPTGILFLPAAAIYLFFRFFRQISLPVKWTILLITTGLFLFILNKLLGIGGSLDFMYPFRTENIICGVPTTEVHIDTLPNGNSLAGLLYYITHNSGQFFRLGWLKTKAFFGMRRIYYSAAHNLYLMVFYYPFYLLALAGIIRNTKHRKYPVVYLLLVILFFWIATILTCDDWHNRFVLTITPWLFLLGLSAFNKAPDRIASK
jgi:hypothetical protein